MIVSCMTAPIWKHSIIPHIKIPRKIWNPFQAYMTNNKKIYVCIYKCRVFLCVTIWCKINISLTSKISESNTGNVIISVYSNKFKLKQWEWFYNGHHKCKYNFYTELLYIGWHHVVKIDPHHFFLTYIWPMCRCVGVLFQCLNIIFSLFYILWGQFIRKTAEMREKMWYWND